MTLSLNCKDTGYPVCTYTMYGETEEKLLQNAKEHRMEVHGYTEKSWNKEITKDRERFHKLIKKNVLNNLFRLPDSKYMDKDKDQLFEQYKLFIQMADKVSERRGVANTFFLSLNSFLLTVLGVLPQLKSNIVGFTIIWIVIVAIGGISFCIAWIMSIRGYSWLNEAKFNVINKIEEKLPVTGYSTEWDYLQLEKRSKILKKIPIISKYTTLSKVEGKVPIIIIILYASLAVGGVLVSLGLIKIPFVPFKG